MAVPDEKVTCSSDGRVETFLPPQVSKAVSRSKRVKLIAFLVPDQELVMPYQPEMERSLNVQHRWQETLVWVSHQCVKWVQARPIVQL